MSAVDPVRVEIVGGKVSVNGVPIPNVFDVEVDPPNRSRVVGRESQGFSTPTVTVRFRADQVVLTAAALVDASAVKK